MFQKPKPVVLPASHVSAHAGAPRPFVLWPPTESWAGFGADQGHPPIVYYISAITTWAMVGTGSLDLDFDWYTV